MQSITMREHGYRKCKRTLLGDIMINLYTFDVFDTLITRKTATPDGIFALMQEYLQHSPQFHHIDVDFRSNFYRIRLNTERFVRLQQSREKEEITLKDIYEGFVSSYALSPLDVEELMDLELRFEKENIVAIQQNIQYLKYLLSQGKKVALLSDMYLSEKSVRSLLLQVDPIFSQVPLFVSSVVKETKASGGLFCFVHKTLGIPYDEWQHMGDNQKSDAEIPRRLGIHIKPFHFPDFLPIERELLSEKRCCVDVQFMIGAARNSRLDDSLNDKGIIGCSIGGPLLVPYVAWILRRCARDNITRLYFIARDGYILKQIADIIIKENQLRIDTFYLYGSRVAWRIPSFQGKENELSLFFQNISLDKITSVHQLAKVLQIDLQALLPHLPKEYRDESIHLFPIDISLIKNKLSANMDFLDFLIQIHAEKRRLVLRYLKENINTCDSDFAFVELQGSGYTTDCMARCLRSFYQGPIRTFFYSMIPTNMVKGWQAIWYLPYSDRVWPVELLCRALHGQTEGYEEAEGKTTPILSPEGNALKTYGYEAYIHGVLVFVKYYSVAISRYPMEVVVDYWNWVANPKDKEVFDFFADMPFDSTGYAEKENSCIPQLTKQDLRQYFLFPPVMPNRFYHGIQLDFAVHRSGTAKQRMCRIYKERRWEIYRRFQQRWHRPLWNVSMLSEAHYHYPELDLILGTRVVLYGAGKIGQWVYYYLQIRNRDIVGWLDHDYEKLRKLGVPVTGNAEKIKEYQYDSVLIAIRNPVAVHSAERALIQCGVKQQCIVSIDDCS